MFRLFVKYFILLLLCLGATGLEAQSSRSEPETRFEEEQEDKKPVRRRHLSSRKKQQRRYAPTNPHEDRYRVPRKESPRIKAVDSARQETLLDEGPLLEEDEFIEEEPREESLEEEESLKLQEEEKPEIEEEFSPLEVMLTPKLTDGLFESDAEPTPPKQFGYEQLASDRFDFDPIANPALPTNYHLGPGDQVMVYNSNPKAVSESSLIVDASGVLNIPGFTPLPVWGKTLDGVNQSLKKKSKFLRASLGRLRSIQVNVIGEANSPGVHQVPAIASVYNVIALIGGIKKTGSLRNIEWKRGQKTIAVIDFYAYLLKGEVLKETEMKSGDTLFIPLLENAVAVTGQVRRPGIFELKDDLTFTEVLQLAGGALPSANTDRVLVERLELNQRRIVKSLQLSDEVRVENFDIIKFFPVSSKYESHFTLVGPFTHEGAFELTEGLTLKEALAYGGKLTKKIVLSRGQIQRLAYQEEQAYTEPNIILFNYQEVVDQDVMQDFLIKDGDLIQVFEVEEFLYITGAVKEPGEFPFVQGMTVEDLLFQAKGFARGANPSRIDIERHPPDESHPHLLRIRYDEMGTPMARLQPNDVVRAYFETEDSILASGAFKHPGEFPFIEGMTVADVLFITKGLGRDAFRGRVDVIRHSLESAYPKIIQIPLDQPESMQTRLQPNDQVRAYDRLGLLKPIVVRGEVHSPGEHIYFAGMTVEDALFQAQQMTFEAYQRQVDVQREFPDGRKKIIEVPLQYGRSDFALEPGDVVIVHHKNIVAPATVSIQGNVIQTPGKYPFLEGMSIKNLILRAGGLKHKALDSKVVVKRWEYSGDDLVRKTFELTINPRTLETTPEFVLQEEDSIFLRLRSEYKQPQFVVISGEVLYPGTYEFIEGERISDVLRRAGGFTERAFLSGVVFTRELLKTKEDAVDKRILKDIRGNLLKSTVDAPASLTSPETQLSAISAVRTTIDAENAPPAAAGAVAATAVAEGSSQALDAQNNQNNQDSSGAFGRPQQEKQKALTRQESEKQVREKEDAKLATGNIGRLVINMEELDVFQKSPDNFELIDGDTLTIPPFLNTVLVKGETIGEASLRVEEDANAYYYIELLGGESQLGTLDNIYVVHPSGYVIKEDLENYPIQAGDTIVVPPDLTPKESSLKETAFIMDFIFKTVTTIVLVMTLL